MNEYDIAQKRFDFKVTVFIAKINVLLTIVLKNLLKALIIYEQNTKNIVAVQKNFLPRFSRPFQHLF